MSSSACGIGPASGRRANVCRAIWAANSSTTAFSTALAGDGPQAKGAWPAENPLYSGLAAQAGLEPLLVQFCRRMGQVVTELRRPMVDGDVAFVRRACLSVRGSAGGSGSRR